MAGEVPLNDYDTTSHPLGTDANMGGPVNNEDVLDEPVFMAFDMEGKLLGFEIGGKLLAAARTFPKAHSIETITSNMRRREVMSAYMRELDKQVDQ